MSGPTLLEALRACAIVFPSGVLSVVGKTDCGSPVSVPLHEGATREAIAALAAFEARPLLEPHALEVAIRERDDARATVDRLAYEVAANRRTIAGFATKVDDERLAHVKTRRLLAEASAEMERARDAATTAIRERMAAVDAMRVAVASASEVRDGSLKALVEACELLRGAATPSGCVDHGPDGVGC